MLKEQLEWQSLIQWDGVFEKGNMKEDLDTWRNFFKDTLDMFHTLSRN